jgi:CRP-like cAMP-binding protein
MMNEKLLEYIRQMIPHSEESTALLAGHFEHKMLEKGEAILKEGQVCHDIYFVEEGYLRTYYNKDGIEINIYFNFEGTVATYLRSNKSGEPSEFTIEAGEKSKIWMLNLGKLTDLCRLTPENMLFSRRLLSRLLVDTSVHNNLLRIYSPAERYQYIEKNNPQLLQRVSLSHMASYLGMTRRTLTRIRGKK